MFKIILISGIILAVIVIAFYYQINQTHLSSQNGTTSIIPNTSISNKMLTPIQIQATCANQVEGYLNGIHGRILYSPNPTYFTIGNTTLFYNAGNTTLNISLWISNHTGISQVKSIVSQPIQGTIDCFNYTFRNALLTTGNASSSDGYVCLDLYAINKTTNTVPNNTLTAIGISFSYTPEPSYNGANNSKYYLSSMSLLCNRNGTLMPNSKSFITTNLVGLIDNTRQNNNQ